MSFSVGVSGGHETYRTCLDMSLGFSCSHREPRETGPGGSAKLID